MRKVGVLACQTGDPSQPWPFWGERDGSKGGLDSFDTNLRLYMVNLHHLLPEEACFGGFVNCQDFLKI